MSLRWRRELRYHPYDGARTFLPMRGSAKCLPNRNSPKPITLNSPCVLIMDDIHFIIGIGFGEPLFPRRSQISDGGYQRKAKVTSSKMAVSWSKATGSSSNRKHIARRSIGRIVRIEKIMLLDVLWAGFACGTGLKPGGRPTSTGWTNERNLHALACDRADLVH
jgi:hypothetical protein